MAARAVVTAAGPGPLPVPVQGRPLSSILRVDILNRVRVPTLGPAPKEVEATEAAAETVGMEETVEMGATAELVITSPLAPGNLTASGTDAAIVPVRS